MVNNASRKSSLKYVFDFSDTEGYWSVPEPKFFHPITTVGDKCGYFGVLHTPTISRYWSFSTLPEVSDMEDEDNSANKSSLKKMDSLHKPAVPVECRNEELVIPVK